MVRVEVSSSLLVTATLPNRQSEIDGVVEWHCFPSLAGQSDCSCVVVLGFSSFPGQLLRMGVYWGRLFSVRRSASSSDWPVPPSSILSTSDSSSAMIFLRPLLRLSLHNGKFHMWGEGSV